MKRNRYLAALACAGLAAGTVSLGHLGNVGLVGAAYAKNGGGNGGGNGNSGGNGDSADHGKSTDHGKSAEAHEKNDAKSLGKDANMLGALNAAHASAKARAHANPRSAVGRIATYEKNREAALALQDPTAQQQALEAAEAKLAASFGMSTLTPDQVSQVNALLDARK